MKIIVIDGQGGGIGRLLVEKLRRGLSPGHSIIAVGANAMATSAMLRAGADAGATGENAVRYNCRSADMILGPSGIAQADAMMGEISQAMADAVRESPAHTLLLPMEPCGEATKQKRALTMEAAAESLSQAALAFVRAREDALKQ